MRTLTLGAVVLVALVAASYAVAHGIEGAKSATKVAGTFNATQQSVSSRTCTTSDNKTIVVTDGKYTGAATGSADLTGAITLRVRSVINTTDKIGTVDGAFAIDVANGKDTRAAFSGVYDNGTVAGLTAGKAHQTDARLLGNFSSSFDPASGFTNAHIGGTSGGSAVELAAGGCKPQGGSTPEKSSARGTISALSATSITVAGLTCAIPQAASAEVNSKFKQGDTAEIRCALVNGTNTLAAIGGGSSHHR